MTVNNVQMTVNNVQMTVNNVQMTVNNVQMTVNEVRETVDEIKEDVERLLCPFGTEGLAQVVRGQGCDGVDQNCNGAVDECTEDQTPPEILLGAVPCKPFSS
jgi:hypothetical protein